MWCLSCLNSIYDMHKACFVQVITIIWIMLIEEIYCRGASCNYLLSGRALSILILRTVTRETDTGQSDSNTIIYINGIGSLNLAGYAFFHTFTLSLFSTHNLHRISETFSL